MFIHSLLTPIFIIVGAFLAGIAITQLIPALSPLMNRIQFIGNNLFIPFFLISVGMLIDLGALISDSKSILITIAMSLSALVVKFSPLLTEDNNNIWGLSIVGIHPEALARLQEDLSLIVFHFPKDL